METYLVKKILPTEETIGGAILACTPLVGIYIELVHIMHLRLQLTLPQASDRTRLNLLDRMNVQKKYNLARNLITSVALVAIGCLTGSTGLIVTGVLYFGMSTYWNIRQLQKNHGVYYTIKYTNAKPDLSDAG